MKFFSKKDSGNKQIYKTAIWDDRLYDALFPKTMSSFQKETSAIFGHIFCCSINKKTTTLGSNVEGIVNVYDGLYMLWLSEHEYCEIPVILKLEKDDSYFDVLINQYVCGYAYFGLGGDTNRTHPILYVVLRNHSGLSDNLAKIYGETKCCATKELKFTWHMILKDMSDSDASSVWNWEFEFNYDSAGVCISEAPAGRKLFPIETYEFISVI